MTIEQYLLSSVGNEGREPPQTDRQTDRQTERQTDRERRDLYAELL